MQNRSKSRPGRPGSKPSAGRPAAKKTSAARGKSPAKRGAAPSGRPGSSRPAPTVRPKVTPAAEVPARAAGTRPSAARPLSLTRVKWAGFREMQDFWGQTMKRYYQLETLANATEASLSWRNSFVFASVHEALGPADISSLHFELFQEGRYQLIFRLRAVNVLGKSANFAFVAAKNHEECSDVARSEHFNLRTLYERMPQHMVRPYRGGTVVLPDRYRRKELDRHVYAYVTGWLNGYDEMGVTRSLQFYVNVEKKHTFTLGETELIKGQSLEIVASSYEETSRSAMALPQIASGDYVVSRQGAEPRIKLIACRRLQKNVTRHKLLSQVLTEGFEWGGRTFKLAPEEPATVLAALTRAWGEETAKKCIKSYLEGVAARRLPGKRAGYLEELRALCDN